MTRIRFLRSRASPPSSQPGRRAPARFVPISAYSRQDRQGRRGPAGVRRGRRRPGADHTADCTLPIAPCRLHPADSTRPIRRARSPRRDRRVPPTPARSIECNHRKRLRRRITTLGHPSVTETSCASPARFGGGARRDVRNPWKNMLFLGGASGRVRKDLTFQQMLTCGNHG